MFSEKMMRKLDLLLLVLFPIISSALTLLFNLNYMISNLLFFGLPALWLSYRTPHKIKHALAFSLIVWIPFTLFIDYIATVNNAWFVPSSIFPFRVFGIVPIENIVQGFLFLYCVLIMYEHFLHKGKHQLVDHHMKYLIWPMISLFLVFIILVFTEPRLLRIRYAFLWIGVVLLLIPSIVFVSKFPKLFSKYAKVAAYFFFVTFIFEITALQINQWTYPGTEFISWLEIFGVRFPFEEFFFWFCILAIAIISYYEFFDDDALMSQKKS